MASKKNSFSQFDGGAGTAAAKRGKKSGSSGGSGSHTRRVAGEPKADNRSTSRITESGILSDMKRHRKNVLRAGIK